MDPISSFLDALDEWGRWLVLLQTCDPAAHADLVHREKMVRQCRSNMELALRHLLAGSGPKRSSSVRMTAVRVDVDTSEDDGNKMAHESSSTEERK